MNVKELVKLTLMALQKKNQTATPKMYADVFCKLAKENGVYVPECQGSQASSAKKEETGEDKELFTVVNLLAESLEPSVSEEIKSNVLRMRQTLLKDVHAVSKIKLQKEIKDLIQQRIATDRKEVAGYTGEVNRVLDNLAENLSDMVGTSETGRDNIMELQQTLLAMRHDNMSSTMLVTVREQLHAIADSMQKELEDVRSSFEEQQNEVSTLKQQVNELQNQLESAKEESREDFLTGTLSRRALESELLVTEEKFERFGYAYSVAFLDLDHFKRINDNYGHDMGDKVLKTFGGLLLQNIRKIDYAGRYGGEEFVVILPGARKDSAISFVEKILETVKKATWKLKKDDVKITFSAGVATRDEASSSSALMQLADERLYKAKKAGRDRMVID